MIYLIVIVSLVLIAVVLVQNSKGGGLDSNFGSQNQAFGARKTTELIEKITWGAASLLAVLCISMTLLFNNAKEEGKDGIKIDTDVENTQSSGAQTIENLPSEPAE